jgi:hypothetical protein
MSLVTAWAIAGRSSLEVLDWQIPYEVAILAGFEGSQVL